MVEHDPEAATPLDPDEAEELLPAHVQTRKELNLWEQENIIAAAKWARRTRKAALDEDFVRELHLRMFDETWGWAGKYRKSDKNIGVHLPTISVEVRNLIDDGRYWLDHDVYSIDEATLRLHHRLVKLHPFVRYERSVHHFVRTVMYHDGRCACSARRADESERRYPEQAERRGARYTSAVIRHRTCELMYY